MSRERFARLKEMLLAVADLPEAERKSHLDAACADDPELRREVEAVLAHGADPSSLMKTGGGIPRELRWATPSGAALAAAPPRTRLPDRVGPYSIEGELGRGGMGVVYAACDPRLGRQVAIKLLPEEMTGDPRFADRFEREARILAAINHPNFATIYSLEEQDGLHFMTMEVIQGSTLAEVIRESDPLPVATALAYCRQVASALEAAHRQGIVHLDLKPQNIMVTPEANVKVLDFGVGRFLASRTQESGTGADSGTPTGVALGTPGYMSPEQLRGEVVDHRADIWAFGCILYECLTGERAFAGQTPPAAFAAILGGEPDWEALPRTTSGRVRELLSRCLAKDPEERLGTMTEARRVIQEEIAQRTWWAARPQPPARDESIPNNLPVRPTSFVGRRHEIEEIKRLLGERRLLTLTGAGGCGKSRLALEVAAEALRDYTDGVWQVELAPLADPELVPRAVAAALGLREQPGRTLTESLADHLSTRRLLLVLDNCEHLRTACAGLAEWLLDASPELRILASSRQALGTPGETIYRVPSLELPDPEPPALVEELGEVESIQLFIERTGTSAPAVTPTAETWAALAGICRRLDGIPLAIELAAARVSVMSVEEIEARLHDRFRLLRSGDRPGLARHQTLRALIDWSWEQLTANEQALLRRLSVFAGGWTLDAAEAVSAGDGIEDWEVLDLLSTLLDKSLVEIDTEKGRHTAKTRYRMLETVRQFAREHLQEDRSGEESAARRRHRGFYLDMVEDAAEQMTGAEQAAWLSRLDAEHDNIRAALADCKAGDDTGVEIGVRMACALGKYWGTRGHWGEARATYAELLARYGATRRTAARAQTLAWAGALARLQGDFTAACSLFEEGLDIRRELGDRRGAAMLLNQLALIASKRGDSAKARSLHEESLAALREVGDKYGIAANLENLGKLTWERGDRAMTRSLFEESLAIRREIGEKGEMARLLVNLGTLVLEQGDLSAARSCYEESQAIGRELGDKQAIAWSLDGLGSAAKEEGDYAAARPFHEQGLAILRELGEKHGIGWSLHGLGNVVFNLGETARARSLHEESLAVFRELGEKRGVAWSLHSLAEVARTQESADEARRLYEEGLAIFRELGDKRGIACSLDDLGNLARTQGAAAEACSLHKEALAMFQELGEALGIAVSSARLGAAACEQGDAERGARLLGAADALLAELGSRLEKEDRELFETHISALRARLGDDGFAREWAAGRAMDREQVIEYALEARRS